MNQPTKKSLAIFSLTCCEGCQFELLNFYDQFADILNFYEIKNFMLAKEENLSEAFDVCLVEGTPETDEELKLLKQVRTASTILIALGTCAYLGGIQAERNFPESEVKKKKVLPLSEVVKVDYVLPGCPINREEAYQVLLDLYHGRDPYQINYPVCFDCRANQVKCLLKDGKACLGPVTASGCNAICTKAGFSCLGCRGPVEQTNLYKMKEVLKTHFTDKELNQRLEIYGEFEKTFTKESNRH
jgi:coenzyme F420-reducing hydrogenase gamma subunit